MHARLPRAWLSWVARGAGGAAGSGLPWRSWLPFEVHRQQRRHVCGERRPQSFTGGSGGLRTCEAMGFRCLQPAAPSFCSDTPPPSSVRCQRQPLSVLGLEKKLSRSAANIYFAASAWLRRAGASPSTRSLQACPPPEMVLFKRGHGGFLGHHISRLEARPWPEPKALIEALLHLSLCRGCQQDRQLLSALAALFCDDLLWGFFLGAGFKPPAASLPSSLESSVGLGRCCLGSAGNGGCQDWR